MKKKSLFLFIAVLICCFIPCFSAFAESNFVNAETKETVAGNPFAYQIDLTALPEAMKTAPYTVTIGGDSLIKEIIFDGGVKAAYDQEKDVYTVTSDQLTNIETLKVTVNFTEAAVAGQQITITTTAANDGGEPVSQDLIVTVTAPPAVPEEGGGENTEGENGINMGGGGFGFGGVTETADGGKTVYAGSANNYLKSLSVQGLDLSSEFHKTNATYFLTVDAHTSAVTVSAKADDNKSTVVVTGNTALQSGLNKVLISVTAENDAVKYYRIYVTKEAN